MTKQGGAATGRSAVSSAVWHWRGEPDQTAVGQPALPRLLRMLAVMAVFGALAWWRGHRTVAACLAGFALVNVLLAAVLPCAFRWHAAAWEKLGRAGALVIGTVALTLAYYLLFAPVALLLRLVGKRPLKLRFPGPEASYWSDVEERGEAEARYRRQF